MTTMPLAEILRAETLDEIVGQDHILGETGLVRQIIASKRPLSLLLYGPPGVGKTSIARLYAQAFSLHFVNLSAVMCGIADVKKIINDGKDNPLFQRCTLLFMDEIHRFNKAQQDAFLPYIENGSIILIGATTENPSFYLNSALLSRMRVLTLNALDDNALEQLILRYEQKFSALPISVDARAWLKSACAGDGRYLFNLIENLRTHTGENILEPQDCSAILQHARTPYDRAGEYHYNLISALHKSVRTSDPDAALYWFARMLAGGEDPLFLARRLIRMASEDIGLADPHALQLAIAARESYVALGSPEGELALAEVVVYLALSPKSNAIYLAYNNAMALAKKSSHAAPPKHILNAPTPLMKFWGYGQGYEYDHDTPQGCSGANNFPENIAPVALYQPVQRGFEREMAKRLNYFNELRKRKA